MNYYKDLIRKLQKIMQEEKYEDAHSLILDEMKTPYVPKKVEEQLESFLEELKSKGIGLEETPKINIDKIVDIISAKETDYATRHGLILMLEGFNLSSREDVVKEIFANTNIELFLKRELLEVVKNNGYDKEVILKYKNGEKVIDIKSFSFQLKDKNIKELSNLLEGHNLELEIAKEMISWLLFNSFILNKNINKFVLPLSIMVAKQTNNIELLNQLTSKENNLIDIEKQIESIQTLLRE